MLRLFSLILLVACGSAGKSAPSAAVYDAYGDEAEAIRTAPAAPSPPPPPPPPAIQAEPPPPPEPVEEAPADRMVHYDGWARMRATDPAATVDAVAALATEAEGRVDRLSGQSVTVRVPVDRFEEVWEQVLALGDVLDKSVRADDITDQYLAVDLRVRTLRMTRDRLVALLAKAESEEEKLALLQQITRVTEELDATESQLRTLADLAAMSRISVDVVPREAFGTTPQGPELAGFEWIRGVSPFRRAVFEDDKRLELPVPEGLVALSKTGPFVAESADGTILWTLRVPNDPAGDGEFWITAIEERIADEFDDPERREVGRWACLALDEPGADEPYHWQICLTAEGRHLQVAQAFYPSPEAVERFGEGIDGALKAGGGA